jgi:uncharacterized protein YgiM (DUF1202 family)
VPASLEAKVVVKGEARPRFVYRYQIVDDGSGGSVGNGDGRIQKGEAVDLVLTVKNTGGLASRETRAEVTSRIGRGLAIRPDTVDLGPLAPEETKTARVRLEVRPNLPGSELPLTLVIRDRGTGALLNEEIKLAIDTRPPPQVVATNKVVVVKEPTARIHGGAGADTPVIASADRGQGLEATGELDAWYRVRISGTEQGWIARAQVAEAATDAKGELPVPRVSGTASVPPVFQNTPPLIALAAPAEGVQVQADRLQVSGAAASGKGIARVEIRVNGAPLTRDGRDISVRGKSGPDADSYAFAEEVRLVEGANEIAITATDRASQSTTLKRTVFRVVDKGTIWALVIGISKYQRVRSLKYADKDAEAFYDYLVGQLGVPRSQVTMLRNEQATLMEMKRQLGVELRRKAGPKDTVIIFYAGHGAPETDPQSPDGDGIEKYIVPYDGDETNLYSTGLPMKDLEAMLYGRIVSERVILITDACYSGASAGRTFATASRRATITDAFLARLAKAKGRVIITASAANEVSEERDDLGHGVFTYYLLEGLRGKADLDGDGLITVEEIYTYVAKKVPEATNRNQNPVKHGGVEGQLVLGRTR